MSELNANVIKTTTIQHTNGTQALVVNSNGTLGNINAGIITATQIAGGALTLSTAQSVSGLGTSVNFTGIPSWVKRVTVNLSEVSTNAAADFLCQLGTSSGFVISGYKGSYTGEATNSNGTLALSSGFFLHAAAAAASLGSGQGTIVSMGSNIWTMQGIFGHSTQGYITYFAGSIPLTGTLDRIRITTVTGTATFDAGTINIMYEG